MIDYGQQQLLFILRTRIVGKCREHFGWVCRPLLAHARHNEPTVFPAGVHAIGRIGKVLQAKVPRQLLDDGLAAAPGRVIGCGLSLGGYAQAEGGAEQKGLGCLAGSHGVVVQVDQRALSRSLRMFECLG